MAQLERITGEARAPLGRHAESGRELRAGELGHQRRPRTCDRHLALSARHRRRVVERADRVLGGPRGRRLEDRHLVGVGGSPVGAQLAEHAGRRVGGHRS
ncbi:MAG: hypothetical protein WAV00_20345 [Nocardioides sp.]